MPSNFNNSPSLTVTLPQSLEGLNLAMDSGVGNITAEGFKVTGDLTIESKTGSVTLGLDIIPASLNVTSDVGNQNITLPRSSYRIETSTDVGNVQLDAETDPDSGTVLRFETSVGNISVRN